MLGATLDTTRRNANVSYTGLLPSLGCLSKHLLLHSHSQLYRSPNPSHITIAGLGSYPFARHYLGNHCFIFFSSGYLDGSVPQVPFVILCIHITISEG